MIALIDYGAGNIFSVKNAFENLNTEIILTDDKDTILAADKVILPGVGSFSDAIYNLKKRKLENTIIDLVDMGKPFLGVCVGLQLMFEHSEEGNVNGLGIFKGKIKKFPSELCGKVPQIGWNGINIKDKSGIFKGVSDNFFYFVHSYYLETDENISAEAEYGLKYTCAYSHKNVDLVQFHPEKSGKTGLKLLGNFVNTRHL